jgi:hypothetical protein
MNEEQEPKHNPQWRVWEDAGIFETYKQAKVKSESLGKESKVRRCGTDGLKYKVKVVKKYLEER